MDQGPTRRSRARWAFWIAAVLAALGGIGPLALGGSRLSGAVIPFAVASVVLGVSAWFYPQGRASATGLYFVAGLAIVYGILFLVAVPLRLALIGTCLPEPSPCTMGVERPLTDGESTGIAFGLACGLVAILFGFYGLATLFRRARPATPATPPTRRIAPVASPTAGSTAPEPEPVAPAPAPAESVPPPPAATTASTTEPKELEAPEEPLELTAHEEPKELPALAAAETPQPSASSPRKPRKQRTPKPPPASDADSQTA